MEATFWSLTSISASSTLSSRNTPKMRLAGRVVVPASATSASKVARTVKDMSVAVSSSLPFWAFIRTLERTGRAFRGLITDCTFCRQSIIASLLTLIFMPPPSCLLSSSLYISSNQSYQYVL